MTTQARRLGVAALVATAIVVTGCGSSSSSSSSTSSSSSAGASSSSTTASTPASTSGSGGAGSQSVTNYLTYVDGKSGKADASLPPVTIGFVNQQGGQQAIGPLATTGAQIAVKYINTELGGIDGHPLVLKTCFIRSAEEEGTTCGQQFLANKSISVIDEGAVAIGDQSFQSTIGSGQAGDRRRRGDPDRRGQGEQRGPVRRRHPRARPVRNLRPAGPARQDRGARVSEHRGHHPGRDGDRRLAARRSGSRSRRSATTRARPT